MKTLIFSIVLSTMFFAACNNGTPKNQTAENTTSVTAEEPGTKDGSIETGSSIKNLLNSYLKIKNALTEDNDKEAADAGNEMVKAFDSFDKTSLTADQAKVYNDIVEDAKEHAEHIGANAGNIEHQREHFETLSQETYELVKVVGAGRKLYVDHCPMYNKNKGANWLSETKNIENPYLGKSMPTCGTIKEELN